jgi:protein-tyrosine phosphatase
MKQMMKEALAATQPLVLSMVFLCSASTFTACSSDDDSSSEVRSPEETPVPPTRQRVIAFEGIENGRDMGSLVMQDGRTVRYDMLVRSGNLATATDADVTLLTSQYHLSDVFDFRFDAEAAAAPDRQIEGVSYTHLPTLPQSLLAAFSGTSTGSDKIDTRDLGALLMKYAFDPKVQEMARQLYPAIVTDADAQAYYGEFLQGVLKAKGGVLWHCSQGKDRAGWASAFVLAALGASREVIVEDFDLSNQSYAPAVEAMTDRVKGKKGSDEAVAFIRAMVGVSRENFEATLNLIDQRYGSLSQYIENQLDFKKEEQQQLRLKYLTTK